MSKTVKEHLEQTDQIQAHIKQADALLIKAKDELFGARRTLEALAVFAPSDQLRTDMPYHLRRDRESDPGSMQEIVRRQVARINALLGDRP